MEKTEFKISQEMVKLIAELDEFKGSWRFIQTLNSSRLPFLQQNSRSESIAISMRLDGINLTNIEIDQILENTPHAMSASASEEVVGYATALDLVFNHFDSMPMTEDNIKQLHAAMCKFSSKGVWRHGKYKTLPNNIEIFDSFGKNIGAVFETTSALETPRQMEKLILWVRLMLAQKEIHPLFVIAIFIVHFLAIHPFQGGNGRLSRILTALLLLRGGYLFLPYYSLESCIIENNKEEFYKALYQAKMGLQTQRPEWENWILFFLQILTKQKNNLIKKLDYNNKVMTILPDLSEKILNLVKEHGRVTVSQVEDVTKANRSRIKSRLRELVEEQYLVRSGKGRASWYCLGKSL